MKISFEFDVNDFDLHPAHLARILLDIQYLVALCAALSDDQLQADNIVFDDFRQKYKRLIEAQGEDLGQAGLTVSRIKMESPLVIDVITKLREQAEKSFVSSFYYVRDHVLFVDLKRKDMIVGIQAHQEEVLERRIKNAAAALDLVGKIPDPKLRQEYLNGLSRTVLSFAKEHPPIKRAKAFGDNGLEIEVPSTLAVTVTENSTSSQATEPESPPVPPPLAPRPENWRPLLRKIVIMALRILLFIILIFVLWNVLLFINRYP